MDKEVLDYFVTATTAKFDRIDDRFDTIDQKLETLITFRILLLGGAAVVATICSTAVVLLAAWIERH